jgi:subtilisin-like proprotein convertase family protein
MHRRPRELLGAVACAAAAALASAPGAVATPLVATRGNVLPNLDTRRADRPPAPTTRAARASLARALGDEAIVRSQPATGTARVVARRDGFLTAAPPADPLDISLGYVREHAPAFGLDDGDLDALRLTSRYRSPDRVTHLAWTQSYDGVDAYDNVLFANVARDGRLVNAGGSAVGDLAVATLTPPLAAASAAATARVNAGGAALAPSARQDAGSERATRFSNGDRARLTIFSDGAADRLAWRVEVSGADAVRYESVVDAASGKLLLRRSLTAFLSRAAVHRDYPSASAGGDDVTVDLAADPTWLDRSDGATRLAGNNARAYADAGGGDGVDPGEDVPASAGTDWLYPRTAFGVDGQPCPLLGGAPACSWDPSSPASEATNRSQATTQLFYFVNRFHDHLASAPIGFTHAARNFEFADADGPLGTGLGGDPVLAEADDQSAVNNANMATGADGEPPRMQMLLFTNPATNSSDSADIVYHEYTHGLTTRTVGTGAGMSALQSQAMGQGWSDWYALDFLVDEGLRTDTDTPGELTLAGYVVPGGIRTAPIDCPVGTLAAACNRNPYISAGGYTLGDMTHVIGGFEVHADGEIWAQTLWDIRRALGSYTARALVTSGLRLSPNDPSFLDMRNAILQADEVAGGAHHDELWSLFAARGMGYGAVDHGANSMPEEAFDVPPLLELESAAVTDLAPGGDGDGVAEPGETVRISPRVRNPGIVPARGARAALSTPTAGVNLTQPTATWPQIAARAASDPAQPLAITLDSAYPCGEAVELALGYSTDRGAGTIELPVAVGSPAAPVLSADVPRSTAGSGGADSALTLAGDDRIQDLEVHVSSLTSPWVGRVAMTLTSPAGTTVRLMSGPGGGEYGAWGAAFKDLVLSDDAATAIEDLPPYGPADGYGGRYRPDERLSAFDGERRAGTWTLHVEDAWGTSSTVVHAWALAPVGGASCGSDPNRRPLAGDDDGGSVVSESTLWGASVLANDHDLDGDDLTAVVARPPEHGSLALAADGTFTYTSDRLFEARDSFTYRARDAKTVSRAATVTIDVTPRANVAPVASPDAYTALFDTQLNGATVLANDSDGDRDPLTAELVACAPRCPTDGSC